MAKKIAPLKPFTKSDLVAAVKARGLVFSSDTLNAVLEEITNAMGRGEKVVLTGFGTLDAPTARARKGIGPLGHPWSTPAGKRARFVAGKNLKQALNR